MDLKKQTNKLLSLFITMMVDTRTAVENNDLIMSLTFLPNYVYVTQHTSYWEKHPSEMSNLYL